jgi:hypothetical protein
MKKLFTIIFSLITLTASTQNFIERYQYWFNSDAENMISGLTGQDPGDPAYSFSTTIGSDGLADGLHVLNMRFSDSEGKWSSVLSRFFYRMPATEAAGTIIDRVSYWFNNDIASATGEAVSGEGSFMFNQSVSVEPLPEGLHVLNLRFRDSEEKWSPVLSRFFYKMPAPVVAGKKLVSYSYWYNNEFENAVEHAVPQSGTILMNEKLDASSLTDGLHVFNIRFRDSGGKWSSTLSRFFYKMAVSPVSGENLVTAYRYWFNENDGGMYNVKLDEPVNPLHLVADIKLPYLETGDNDFSIQFMDMEGKWSPALTETFEVGDCLPGNIEDPSGEVEVCQATEHIYRVNGALNITDYEWSLTPAGAGILDVIGSEVTVSWDANFTGTAQLAVYGSNPCGQTETRSVQVEVIALPYVTAMDDLTICEGESIMLEIVSSRGVVEWNVENINVSPAEQTTYTVTATNLCGSAEDVVVIGVDTYPSLSVMDNAELCRGESIELTATYDGTITWSSGSSTVSPAETTVYTATARNGKCEVSDQVAITVKPVPYLQVMGDAEICEGEELVLTAESDETITWSSGSVVVYPVESGFYTAFAEKDGCVVQKEVFVEVHPVPDIPVLEQVDEMLVSSWDSGNTWFFNGAELEGVTGPEYSPGKEGDFYVRAVSSKGCISEPSNTVSFIVSNLIKIDMGEFAVFPNPVNDELFIDPGTFRGGIFRIELMALDGTVLLVRKLSEQSHINVANLAPSVYILRISHGDESRSFRIIKN